MATGHILPGYGNPVTQLRRARSAGYPLENKKIKEWVQERNPPITEYELEEIRAQAKRMWSAVDREPTTYQFQHSHKQLDEPTQPRPTSTSRRHKPHPPLVFLTNRLHYIDGFNNPDYTIGKNAYQVDASHPLQEQQRRRHIKSKYIGRPCTAALCQYEDKIGIKSHMANSVDAQAAEAWVKIADDKDKPNVFHEVQRQREVLKLHPSRKVDTTPIPIHQDVPSIHRYLKNAGQREKQDLYDAIRRKYNNHRLNTMPNMMLPSTQPVDTLNNMQNTDFEKSRIVRYVHKPTRGDYLMHPEWPPTFKHHTVPGY